MKQTFYIIKVNAVFVLLLAAGWLFGSSGQEAAAAGEEAEKKIVLIAGALDDHPPATHEYEKSALLLKHCLDTAPNLPSLHTEVHFKGWPSDATTLDNADTIVLISGGSDRNETDHPLFVGEHLSIVDRQMQRGCGLVVIHWTTFAPLRAADRMLEWVGGFFDYESGPPPRRWLSAITTREWRVSPATPAHPILRGIPEPFALNEEFYYKIRFREEADPRLKPIWQVDLDDHSESERTTAWCVERADGGRGFATTGGHFYANWEAPSFRRTILNAIVWTAKIDPPEGGVESSMLYLEETRGVETPKPIHGLIVTGHNHPAHDWLETTKVLSKTLREESRLALDITHDPHMLRKADLEFYDVIVLNYSNWDQPGLSEQTKERFQAWLDGGGGLVIVHYANGSWYKTAPAGLRAHWAEYAGRICRRYWDHERSGHDAYGKFEVRITDHKHPITEGLNGTIFETEDELYYQQAGDLPIEPLAVARSSVTGKDEPMAFAYDYGMGRVFQTVLGHAPQSLGTPGTAALVRRGTVWAAGAQPGDRAQ